MKVAAAVANGKIAPSMSESTEVLIVTEENGQPVSKETIAFDGANITGALFGLSMKNIDIMLAGEVGTALQQTLRMIGMHVLPGCQGDAIDCIAGLLAGEKVGDPSKIVIPEEDENDPMSCMHDCSKCMAGCAEKPEENR